MSFSRISLSWKSLENVNGAKVEKHDFLNFIKIRKNNVSEINYVEDSYIFFDIQSKKVEKIEGPAPFWLRP